MNMIKTLYELLKELIKICCFLKVSLKGVLLVQQVASLMKVRITEKSEGIPQPDHSTWRIKMKDQKWGVGGEGRHLLQSSAIMFSQTGRNGHKDQTHFLGLVELEAASAKIRGTSCFPDSLRARQPQKNKADQLQGPGHSPEFLRQDYEKEASQHCCIIYTQLTALTLPGPTLKGNLLFSAWGMSNLESLN